MGHRRESRARSLADGPGRGWTLQFSGLETLEKARKRIQLFTTHPALETPKPALLRLPAQIVRCIRMAVPPETTAPYFRHKPRVRNRRSLSILRSTIVWSSSAFRRRTSWRRSPQSQGRVAGGRVSSCSWISSISSSTRR